MECKLIEAGVDEYLGIKVAIVDVKELGRVFVQQGLVCGCGAQRSWEGTGRRIRKNDTLADGFAHRSNVEIDFNSKLVFNIACDAGLLKQPPECAAEARDKLREAKQAAQEMMNVFGFENTTAAVQEINSAVDYLLTLGCSEQQEKED